jgi:hypothetical protein
MPQEREYFHNQHNVMKLHKPPVIAADPSATAIKPPEPEPNPLSEKVGNGWVPRPFVSDRNQR